MALWLGLLALLAGPLLGPALVRRPAVAAVLDGFVVVTVFGLVTMHVAPQSAALAGPAALVAMAIGAVVPALLHRLDARGGTSGARDVVVYLVFLIATLAHALLDGVALAGESPGAHAHGHDDGTAFALAAAVLLHRVPVSIALWLVARPRLGTARTVGVLLTLALGTVLGSVVGAAWMARAAEAFALVQAFAAGGVLHVMIDAPAVEGATAWPRASLLGATLAVAVLVALHASHPDVPVVDNELAVPAAFAVLATRVAPAFVIALPLSAVASALRRREVLVRGDRSSTMRGVASALVSAMSGVRAGAQRQVCSCDVVASVDGMVRRRASPGAALSFAVAAPLLHVPSVCIAIALWGPALGVARVVVGVVLALVIGVLVGAGAGRARATEDAVDDTTETHVAVDELMRPTTAWGRVRASLLATLDHEGPWLLVAIALCALLEPLVPPLSLLSSSSLSSSLLASSPLRVAAFALVGVPVYVCASVGPVLGALLLHKGASAGAALAFVVVGPAIHATGLLRLSRSFGTARAVAYALLILVGATASGLVLDALWPDAASSSHALGHDASSSLAGQVAAGLVALLVLGSIARQGVRGFLGQIFHPLDDARGGHVHGPHCGHAGHATPSFVKKEPVARVAVTFRP